MVIGADLRPGGCDHRAIAGRPAGETLDRSGRTSHSSRVTADPDHEAMAREILSMAPFLSDLSREELVGLADNVTVASVRQGEAVVTEGSPGDSLFIVSKGILSVWTTGAEGNQVEVGTLVAGDFFGEISMLLGRPRTATVVAASDVVCLEIGRESWASLQRVHPRLRSVLEESLQARASNSAEAVVEDFRRRKAAGGRREV
jgi:CRP-like cAMP-binding protein